MTLWHGRLSGGTADVVMDYSVSIHFDQRLARDDIAGSRAHVRGLGRGGLLTADEVGEFIQFTVRDTGRGIEADRLGTIFDRFNTYSEKSSGLGLALVRRLVESLGGQIAVESRIGQGTTFRISLPVAASVEKHHPVEVG